MWALASAKGVSAGRESRAMLPAAAASDSEALSSCALDGNPPVTLPPRLLPEAGMPPTEPEGCALEWLPFSAMDGRVPLDWRGDLCPSTLMDLDPGCWSDEALRSSR